MIEIENPLESYREHPGPILLLAGPGTGKTYQIEKRIAYLIQDLGVSPAEIAVITFTTAAARSMRKRLAHEQHGISPDKTPGIVTTMHSLGNTIIGRDPCSCGLPQDYRVLTESHYREVLFRDGAVLAGVDPGYCQSTDEQRRKGICAEDMDEPWSQICKEYEKILRKCGLVDYDDQIMLSCKLLRSNKELATEFRKQTRYLLVDEYQDINEAQCEFIQLLTDGQAEGLFAVGDDDQSIYSFRGGDPKYICHFEDYYGGSSKIGRLSKSWRCSEHILLGAQSVVEKYYPDRVKKPDATFSDEITLNNNIILYDMPSEKAEAGRIATIAEAALKEQRSVIVIVPNGNYFPPIRDALIQRALSFNYKREPRKEGLIRFAVLANWVERKENSSLLRYLLDLVIANHDDLLKKLPLESTKLTERRAEASKLIAELWKDVSPEMPLYNILAERSDSPDTYPIEYHFKTGCLDLIEDALTGKDYRSRRGLPGFLTLSGLMVAPGKNPQGFLEEIENWQIDSRAAGSTSYLPVEIYNMPSCKGLQAQVICVIGLSEGIFPRSDDDLAEKARLLYVAMTRAKDNLYLFSCRSRSAARTFSNASYQLKPSTMVEVVPKSHLEKRSIYISRSKRS